MTATPRLAQATTVISVWMEDSDFFDGNALYTDLDTAKAHAAYDYEGYEYGHPDEDGDDEGANIRPAFTWEEFGGQWSLIDHGKDTHVRVAECTVWRPATPREIEQQDALAAAEEKTRAKRPHMPLAAALEHEAAKRPPQPPA